MKVKSNQLATNIKIKGAAASSNGPQVGKHSHNQSVAVVQNQNQLAKVSMSSIENLNQAAPSQSTGQKKIQMHAKHQSLNTRATNAQNNSVIINGSSNNNNQSQSPSTVHRNKKALYRMIKM